VDTFGANQVARIEPFDALELELGLPWEDGTTAGSAVTTEATDPLPVHRR
jgi:hypothetical protein